MTLTVFKLVVETLKSINSTQTDYAVHLKSSIFLFLHTLLLYHFNEILDPVFWMTQELLCISFSTLMIYSAFSFIHKLAINVYIIFYVL